MIINLFVLLEWLMKMFVTKAKYLHGQSMVNYCTGVSHWCRHSVLVLYIRVRILYSYISKTSQTLYTILRTKIVQLREVNILRETYCLNKLLSSFL